MKRILLNYTLPAALLLGLPLPVTFVLVFVAERSLPMHQTLALGGSVVAGLSLVFLGGGWWGRSLAQTLGGARRNRAFWAAAIANLVLTLGAAQTLGQLELAFVERHALGYIPIHVIFGGLFTAAAFAVTTLLVLVLGVALHPGAVSIKLAVSAGLAAGATFLLADVVQDLLGRRVGGPNAEATITMLSVAFIGNFLAAGAAGTVLGWRLTKAAPATPPTVAAPEAVSSAAN